MPFIRIFIICFSLALSVSSEVQAVQEFSSLLQQGQDNIVGGHFREASKQLQQVEATAQEQQDAYTVALAQGLQGYIALQHQDYDTAEQQLTAVLAQAKQNSWHDLQARFALYLGQLQDHKHNNQQARAFFEQALLAAEKINDKSLLVSTRYQLAKLLIDEKQTDKAYEQLQQAKTLLETLPANNVSSQLWLNIGYQTSRLFEQNTLQTDYLNAAFDELRKALTQAEHFSQLRTQAAALKHLAGLYKQQQQPTEAIKLLQAGIEIAQKEQADDLLFDLEWQLGQLYKQQQSPQLAIAAYRNALKHLENIRLDIPVSYEQGKSSFKNTFAPLYLGLADLLLQQAPLAKSQQQQAILQEAQDTIELMKKSELEDYFQSRCEIPAKPLDLQKNDFRAAAIYPIPLPERLELIVYTKDGLHQFTQAVPAQLLEQQARSLVTALRNPASDWSVAQKTSQLLYQWLISPIKPLLEQQKIETLIYIPDGVLRLVPLAALSADGKRFLIEDYAVVNSAGTSFTEYYATSHKNQDMLLVGMSVPGNVIHDLPDSLLNGIFSALPQEKKRQLSRNLQPIPNSGLTAVEQKNRQLRKLLEEKPVLEEFQKELSLPGVEVEIKQLAQQNQVDYFLNEDFSLARFIELITEKPHKILHIASHGFFGSTAEESFIMTSDKILTMNKLEVLLNSEYFKKNPIDLITLSACQTAEGDDRSPLGISGIAIKSKAHSALGSLWPVADDATGQLMASFYQALKQSDNKAKALQNAEIQLLKQPQFKHPAFWAPFILVGDWL
jgi:CHAT domain-containing protein